MVHAALPGHVSAAFPDPSVLPSGDFLVGVGFLFPVAVSMAVLPLVGHLCSASPVGGLRSVDLPFSQIDAAVNFLRLISLRLPSRRQASCLLSFRSGVRWGISVSPARVVSPTVVLLVPIVFAVCRSSFSVPS